MAQALRDWFPRQTDMPPRRALLAAAFALVAIALTGAIGAHFLEGPAAPFLAASMGAAAVLLFIVPNSPMSTPWALVGGHLVSVTIGVTLWQLLESPLLAAPLAVGAAIAAMYFLRCLHPPGGAAALLSVVGGEPVHQLGYAFLVTPVGLNVAVMLAMLLLYRRLLRHARRHHMPGDLDDYLDRRRGVLPFEAADLHRAMAEMEGLVDVTAEDLERLYLRATAHAHARQRQAQRCGDIAEAPVAVEYATDLGTVWRLMQEHELEAVPVVDRVGHVLGLVTRADFLEEARRWGDGDCAAGLRCLCRPSGTLESERPEAAGQIMRRPVPCAAADDPAPPWLERLFREALGVIPVVDERRRLQGLIRHRAP